MNLIKFINEYANRKNAFTKVVLEFFWKDDGIDEDYCFEGTPSEFVDRYTKDYTVALEEIEGCIADQKTVEDEIEARELARIIEAFLDTLTVKERVIFMRRYAYADTYADIAKRVGISEKNVSVRLTLIRQKMKQYLIEREVFV